MLDRLGMGELLDADTDELSGGQAKRVALARLLVGEHDLLILDEPTNHLDLDAIAFLEEWLAAYRGGLVLVTHDRHVLDRVTTKVLETRPGHGVPARARRLARRIRLRGLPRRSRRARGQAEAAEQARRNLAAERAGLVAARRAGTHQQAQGAHRDGHCARGGHGPMPPAGPAT